ncbi:MAG: YHYH protein [Aliiglaciecola sp.]|uniref:YHYH protein n=1 Tax=Aliiglaciecola sp. TaxID=1872441 RepID=UPI003297429F
MMRNMRWLLLVLCCAFSLLACSGENSKSQQQTNSSGFVLTSSAMVEGGNLPVIYTCDGLSVSPPLSWSRAPESTQSYVLIMDHKAPDGMHWYWTMYNISPETTQIDTNEILGVMGSNSVNHLNQYAPPCSKGPGEKRYTFNIYALSEPVSFSQNSKVDRSTLLAAMQDITLDSAQLNVTYERGTISPEHTSNQGNKPRADAQRGANTPSYIPPDLSVNIDSARCQTIQQSVADAGFAEQVKVVCDENYAYVVSSTYPDHEMMTGITGTNEQIPVPAKGYAAPIKLNPKKANSVTTIDAALGVAVNGVPIYDYSSQGELDVNQYDAKHDTLVLGQLDNCGGHAGRGDDYHYHVSPTCMIDTMKNQGSDAIIGWAYDGYPLYGDKNPDGSDITLGELDECNGQGDDNFGYRYQTSATPPYIIQCLVGEVDTTKLPRVAPLSGDSQGIRADLRPPAEGVENLTHSVSDDGSRTMSYLYKGERYFTTYRPSIQEENCFDFQQKTISNGGKLETGTFCRNPQQPKNTVKAAVKHEQNPNIIGEHHFKLEAWADNWFAAYVGEELLIEDSVSIHTERSFNAETIAFSANYPIQLNLILKDFKQNDTGLEYIGARNQQMGDGGFIMQITDTDTNEVVSVTDSSWKCEVLHRAPLNKLCEKESNPVAGEGYCTFMSKDAPQNWLQRDFDDSAWANATQHQAQSVGPKDGYSEINWNENAHFIWGEDLETDNTLICRASIEEPK